MDGSLTPGSALDTVVNPGRLSPSQRQLASQRLLEEDSNRFLKTAVNLATNPFVWLTFLVSPVGAKALRQGKRLSEVRKEFSLFQKKEAGAFAMLKSALDDVEGTNAQNVVAEIADTKTTLMDRLNAEASEADVKLVQALEQKHGKLRWARENPLDFTQYAPGTKERKVLEQSHAYVDIKGKGLDGSIGTEPVVQGKTSFRVVYENMPDVVEEEVLAKVRGSDVAVRLDFDAYKANIAEYNSNLEKHFKQNLDQLRDENPGLSLEGLREKYVYGERLKVVMNKVKIEKDQALRKTPSLVDADSVREFEQQNPEVLEWAKAHSRTQKKAFVMALGDEKYFNETGKFKMDQQKAYMAISSMRASLNRGDEVRNMNILNGNMQGKDLIMGLVDNYEKVIADPDVDMEEAFDTLMTALDDVVDTNRWNRDVWVSNNTFKRAKVRKAGSTSEYVEPPLVLHELDEKALDEAPFAYTSSNSGAANLFAPLTSKDIRYDMDTLDTWESLGFRLTDEGRAHGKETRKMAERLWNPQNQSDLSSRKAMLVADFNPVRSRQKYVDQLVTTHVLNTRPMQTTASRDMFLDKIADERKGVEVAIRNTKMAVDAPTPERLKKKGMSATELLSLDYMAQRDIVTQSLIRDAVGSAIGSAGPQYMAVRASVLRNKAVAKSFADSMFGKVLEKHTGEGGKAFIQRIRHLAESPDMALDPGGVSGMMANYLYTTHLGFNLGSVILNLTQPLLLAAAVGTPAQVLGAFADSAKETFSFIQKRLASGKMFLTPEEKLTMMRDSFEMMGKGSRGRNVLGIGPNMHAILDHNMKGPGGAFQKFQGAALGLFELSEWFNRNTTAHLVKRIYMKQTGARTFQELHKAMPDFNSEVEKMVYRLQFAQHDINQPKIFQTWLRNPLARQFMSFPIRQAYTTLGVMPKLGGEGYWQGLARTMARGMGYSAITFELGRGLLGVDLSSGLFTGSLASVAGMDRLSGAESSPIPTPPVVKIPWDLMRGMATDDDRLTASAISRLVPGGVAFSRAWGLAPEAPEFLRPTQPTYVDWNNPLPTGEVPVYKSDGTLVAYRSRTDMILRALGADMGRWKEQGEIDGYLMKQGDVIASYKRRYLEALYGNDSSGAEKIKKEFQDKFNFPLAISQQQLSAFIKSKEQGRTERVATRLPPEARESYKSMLLNTAPNIQGGYDPTVPAAQRPRVNPLSADEIERLRAEINAGVGPAGRGTPLPVGASSSQQGGSFQSFGSF